MPSGTEDYDWRSTKPQRDMIYDTAGKMSKKECSLWYKLGRTIIESRASEYQKTQPEDVQIVQEEIISNDSQS